MKVYDLVEYSSETQSDPSEKHTLYSSKEIALKHLEKIKQEYSKHWSIKNYGDDSFDVKCGNWFYSYSVEEVPVLDE